MRPHKKKRQNPDRHQQEPTIEERVEELESLVSYLLRHDESHIDKITEMAADIESLKSND